MRMLLIDIGNSRLKWRRLQSGRSGPVRSLPLPTGAGGVPALRRLLRKVGPVNEIWVSNVAGGSVQRALRAAARAEAAPSPRFVVSARRQAGVRNGYRDVWRLGVDRWLAMIGAHARHAGRALCIVNVGTALTIDLLDSKGVHRGGLIAAGPALMQQALLRDTAGIRRRTLGILGRSGRGRWKLRLFARDTRAAVEQGTANACAALIERAAAGASRELGCPVSVLLGGGAAAALRPLLRLKPRREPDLVLRGLAVLARREQR